MLEKVLSLRRGLIAIGSKKFFVKWFKVSPYFLTVLFLLSLFCSFLKPLPLILFGTQFNLGFYFSVIGIILFFFEICFKECNKELTNIIRIVFFVFILLFLSSLFMALIQYPFFKGFRNYDYWFEFFKGVIKWAYNAVCFCYIAFSLRFIKFKHLLIWTYFSTYVFLLLTLIHFLIFLNPNSSLANFYDKINVFGILNDSSFIVRIKNNNGSFRAFGFSSEPAGVQFYSCVIWIPCYLWGCLKLYKQKLKIVLHILSFAIAFGLIILTASSSVYIFVFSIMLVLALRLLFKGTISIRTRVLSIVFFCLIVAALFVVPFSRELIIRYFSKILDFSNQSTLHRYSSLWNAAKIFFAFPLLGVGDGFQGLYYFDNMVGTVFQHNLETQAYMFQGIGISGGGAMIPTILSGFGILGIAILVIYLFFCIKICNLSHNNFFSFTFLITFLGAILSFTVSAGIYFSFSALFYFALPLINYRCTKRNEIFYKITI